VGQNLSFTGGLHTNVTPVVASLSMRPRRRTRFVEEGAAQGTLDGRPAGRVVYVIPLLVEYSEDDDTGCGFGAAVMIVVVGSLLLLRLATTRTRR
jgi:hypothetical protein